MDAGERQAPEAGPPGGSMLVLVHVKQRCIPVSCGAGSQPVRWLANVAITRHDDSLGRSLGPPAGVKLASGQLVPLQQTLLDAGIRDGQHVWVVLKGAQRSSGGSPPNVLWLCARLPSHLSALTVFPPAPLAGQGAAESA
eukprot:5129697-Prymnesium_polylepis.2